MRRLVRGLLVLLLVAGGLRAGADAGADEVVLEDGEVLRGSVHRVGGRLRVNPHRSSVPAMTWGVIELDPEAVATIRPERRAVDLWRALRALPPGDVAGRAALLEPAREARLGDLRRRIAAEILVVRPDHAEALEVVGGARAWEALRRGRPALDADLRRDLHRLLRLESGLARKEAAVALEAEHGYPAEAARIERMARSRRRPRGDLHDVPLAWALDDDLPAATLSLHVPPDHDGIEPLPLVVALHGGAGGTGSEVVTGTPRDAMALFGTGAREHGVLLACPAAREVDWTSRANQALVEAVLAEIPLRYPVDLERIHLVGQGDGAEGVLAFARRHADELAGIGVAGARGVGDVPRLARRGLFAWIHHGADDPIAPVEEAREAARRSLRRRGGDVVYTELPGEGHGLPAAAEADLYHHLLVRRRARAADAWPRSSFAQPVRDAEREALGDPALAWGRSLPEEATTEDLLARLATGWPEAEPAARRLAEGDVPTAGVAALLGRPDAPPDARAWGAWLLGRAEGEVAIDALADRVRLEDDALARRMAVEALTRRRAAGVTGDLLLALEDVDRAWRVPGPDPDAVTWWRFDETCRLAAAIVEALGTCGEGEGIGAAIERVAVRGILRDARTIEASAAAGEDAEAPRVRLAEACGRAYRALEAEPTLFDMLRVVLRDHPAALRAAVRGRAEGLDRGAR